jgi:molybdopterin-guanine dinucleotide biosynthesis protein A
LTLNELSYNPPKATGAILAGGASSRMGRDKLPLKVGDVALLDRVHNTLVSCCEDVLIIGAKEHAFARTRLVSDLRPYRQGPLAGIEAGLLAARHLHVFVAAADMPFITSDLVKYLLSLLSNGVCAVVPDFGGRLHPLCAAYEREVRVVVSAALDRGVRSLSGLLEGLSRVRYVGGEELQRFGDPELLLMNVNSPEDLARARAVLREGMPHGG